MLRKYKREKRGDVVQYIIVLAFVVSLLTVFAPQIKEVMFGSTNDSVANIKEVTKPMEGKENEGNSNNGNSTNSGGTTTPPPPPIVDPKPKTYEYVKINVTENWVLQSRSYANFGAPEKNVILQFDLNASILGDNMKKIRKNGTNLRFFTTDFKELPFYIGQWGGTSQNANGDGTMIWIRTPAEYTIKEVIMVFGGDDLNTKSDGKKFFTFYDDFNSPSQSKTLWKNISDSQIQNGALTLNAGQALLSNQTFSEQNSAFQHILIYAKEIEQKNPFEFGFQNYYVQLNQQNKETQGSYYYKPDKGLSLEKTSADFSDAVQKVSPFNSASFLLDRSYGSKTKNSYQFFLQIYDSILALVRETPMQTFGSIYVKPLDNKTMKITEIFMLTEKVYITNMAAEKGVQGPKVPGVLNGSFVDKDGIIR